MEFEQLILQRQSCRKYNPTKKVSVVDLDKILFAAAVSPSAKNFQPWRFYVPQTQGAINNVRNACTTNGGNAFLKDVDTFVVVTLQKAQPIIKPVGITTNDWRFFDCGMCVMQLTLCAKQLGIDSCIIGWINEETLSSAINMPESEQIGLVVALGYADDSVETRTKIRRPLVDTLRLV